MKKNIKKQKKLQLFENYLEEQLKFNFFLKKLGIKKNDKVLVSSRLMLIISNVYKNTLNFNLSLDIIANKIYEHIINKILEKIGKNGTLLIPTYNWDFCKGKRFDYFKTPSSAGDLGNYALKNKKFKRTINPIYSFAVIGKDRNRICKFRHESCFGNNSPFEYLIRKNGKNLFIGLKDYREGFHFPYVAEEKVGVNHRFFKYFKGKYKKGNSLKNYTAKMYVRKIEQNKITYLDNNFKNILKRNKFLKEIKNNKIIISSLLIKKTYQLMVKDLMTKKKFVTTKSYNVQ